MKNLSAIWDDIIQHKIYIMGGCGALYDGVSPDGTTYNQPSIQQIHQAYGRQFQLPQEAAHNEICAQIGMMLFSWRMFQTTGDAKYIDNISKRTVLQKILFYPLVLPLFIIDIAYQALSLLFSFIVQAAWYCYVIFRQVAKVFAKIGNWLLSLSDRTVIAISFRLAIILGLSIVVVCNSYSSLFRLKEESSAAFEFISSAIVIPVILEWVMSYKQGKAKTPKEEHHVSRPENP